MSGGHFGDYDYYKVHQFADELEVEIHNNNKPDEYGYVKNYSPETCLLYTSPSPRDRS